MRPPKETPHEGASQEIKDLLILQFKVLNNIGISLSVIAIVLVLWGGSRLIGSLEISRWLQALPAILVQ